MRTMMASDFVGVLLCTNRYIMMLLTSVFLRCTRLYRI